MSGGAFLATHRDGDRLVIELSGTWRIDQLGRIEEALEDIDPGDAGRVDVRCAGLQALDLAGAWLVHRTGERLRSGGVDVRLEDFPAGLQQLLSEIDVSPPERSGSLSFRPLRRLHQLGRTTVERVADLVDSLGFFGRVIVTLLRAFVSLRRLRIRAVFHHAFRTGVTAVPIVALIAFLISVVLAYMGSQQLKQFGAEIFTVDLVAIAVLREMGVLLTAIMVAGRSGSAFAAELGVMKLNEEIDALRAMGLDPYEVLVAPRVLALIIVMPLLTIIADGFGLAGGALLSMGLLDISINQFVSRLQEALAPTTFWVGIIKAPVFAFLIGFVGALRGMQVSGSSQELGRLTTVAVVQSIFLVILADALFAVLFQELDI